MSTNSLSQNLRITESHLSPNILLEKDIRLGICSSVSWNGAFQTTTLTNRLTEGVSSGGCGILQLYTQLALTNLSSCLCILVPLHTLGIPCSCCFVYTHTILTE